MSMITLFHSCEARPTSIGHDLFGDFMFFTEYEQTTRGDVVLTIDVDDDQIIDVEDVLFHETDGNMRRFVERARQLIKRQQGIEIDEDLAEDLVTQRVNYDNNRDFEDNWDCEIGWEIQMLGAEAAKVAGFRGVRVDDEMGRSIVIDMTGREAELVELVEEDA